MSTRQQLAQEFVLVWEFLLRKLGNAARALRDTALIAARWRYRLFSELSTLAR